MSLDDAISNARQQLNVDTQLAYLGNGSGDPRDRKQVGNYFVRIVQADGRLSAAISMPAHPNAKFPVNDNFAVRLGYDEDGEQVILGAYRPGVQSAGINPLILNPLDTVVNSIVTQAKFSTFYFDRHGDTTNKPLTVSIFPAFIVIGTVTTFFAGDEIDISSFVPSTDLHCFVVIFWKTDNTLEAFSSTPTNTADPLSDADIQEAINQRSTGSLPICAWRLVGDQVALTSDETQRVDLRQMINVVEESSGGSSLIVTDGTTTVDPTSEIDFDPAFFDVTSPGGDVAAVTLVNVAPDDATYITQTPSSGLSAEQALSALATGLMKVTTTTGIVSSITDSAGLAGVISDETGSGALVFGTSPTIATPTIADFTNAQHDHLDADDGGTLDAAAIASGQLALARGGTHADLSATGGANQFLKQSSVGANVSVGTIADADVPNALTIDGGTINNTPIGATTANTLIATALSLLIGGFKAIFSHNNTADRTYRLQDISATLNRDLFVYAKNVSGSTIAAQKPIYFNGASGVDNATIAGLAVANSTRDKLAEGFTVSSIANNDFGFVQIGGVMRGYTIAPGAYGDLFLDTSAGGVTNTAPTGANYAQRVGNISFALANSDLLILCDAPLPIGVPVGISDAQTLTNKTLTAPTVADFTNANHDHLDADDGGTLSAAAIASGTLDEARLPHKFAVIEEQQAQGTAGGTSVATTWTTRVLNTEVADADNLVTLSSNKFTPIAGTYRIFVNSPFIGGSAASAEVRIRLRNVTATSVVLVSNNNHAIVNGGANCTFATQFTANGTDEYDIQYYITVARTTNGLGIAVNEASSVERYTNCLLEKIA